MLRKNFFCGKENHERINAAATRLQEEPGVWGGALEKFAFLTLKASLSYEKDKYLASQFLEKTKFQLRKVLQFCKVASQNAK